MASSIKVVPQPEYQRTRVECYGISVFVTLLDGYTSEALGIKCVSPPRARIHANGGAFEEGWEEAQAFHHAVGNAIRIAKAWEQGDSLERCLFGLRCVESWESEGITP